MRKKYFLLECELHLEFKYYQIRSSIGTVNIEKLQEYLETSLKPGNLIGTEIQDNGTPNNLLYICSDGQVSQGSSIRRISDLPNRLLGLMKYSGWGWNDIKRKYGLNFDIITESYSLLKFEMEPMKEFGPPPLETDDGIISKMSEKPLFHS